MSKKKRQKRETANKVNKRSTATEPERVSALPLWLRCVAVVAIVVGVFLLTRSSNPDGDTVDSGSVARKAGVSTSDASAVQSQDVEPLPTLPGLEQQRFDSVVRSVAEREDPVLDGWESEHFSELAGKQLKSIGKWISESTTLTDEMLEKVVSSEFACAGLRPANLASVFADSGLEVFRGDQFAAAEPENSDETLRRGGLECFRTVIKGQADAVRGLEDARFKFKIVGVDTEGVTTDTTAYFQTSGRRDGVATQVNATWHCRWKNAPEHPLLESVRVERYEEVVHKSDVGAMFADCTESVFRNSDRFQRQLVYGIDHWTDRFDGAIARPAAGHGIAIGDVNGDGLEDVYLCQSPALPNLLLVQNADGSVRDTAVEAGVHWLEGTRAALLADLDNDGDQDLVAVLGSKVVIQANDGKGHFEVKTIISSPSSLFQINAVDYDNDADLDLFICGYTLSSGVNLDDVFANPMPFHDATNGAPNVMLRNDGEWQFEDITNDVGLDQNSSRFSYASSWDDFDNDGDLDVYVANDFGRNNLYRNDDGHFNDVAAEMDVEDIGPGMSAAWGDFNNDGQSDIYVSNMFSSAGNRITSQKQFKAGLNEQTKGYFQRHARGNSLFENTGDGQFRDRSVDLGVTLGRWAWGSLFVDLNNDGWEDLYVTNGFVTADDTGDL